MFLRREILVLPGGLILFSFPLVQLDLVVSRNNPVSSLGFRKPCWLGACLPLGLREGRGSYAPGLCFDGLRCVLESHGTKDHAFYCSMGDREAIGHIRGHVHH